jgi:1-deoxy-D-xylulose-5-phosphate reductoisomerase
MKNIVILGSTGSIGENALRVIEALPGGFNVLGLAVRQDFKRALEQAQQFGARHIAVADQDMARQCAAEAASDIEVHHGPEGVEELAGLGEADILLCALVGMAGLKPVMAAVGNGTDVALATKEVLVAAGQAVTAECSRHGARLLPVDSEHNAILQCLAGIGHGSGFVGPRPPLQDWPVKRLILTASGGPFVSRPDMDFDKVTLKEALDHPNWNMGTKVTIDSATLMNKGLEIMEARWLFGVPIDRIEVVVHPESIVHSMVEFIDGNILAQMSLPDMRFAIQYALTYPERVDGNLPQLDVAGLGELHFMQPDMERFPCLALAREAAGIGGTMPAVLNAANEVAVEGFVKGRLAFSGIWRMVEKLMGEHKPVKDPSLDDIIEADRWTRERGCTGVQE